MTHILKSTQAPRRFIALAFIAAAVPSVLAAEEQSCNAWEGTDSSVPEWVKNLNICDPRVAAIVNATAPSRYSEDALRRLSKYPPEIQGEIARLVYCHPNCADEGSN